MDEDEIHSKRCEHGHLFHEIQLSDMAMDIHEAITKETFSKKGKVEE
jgi:hypothetical protein